MNFACQLPAVQPRLGEGLHEAAAGWNPNTPMQLDYVDAPPVIIIEERSPSGRPAGTTEESDSPGGGS